MANKKEQVMNKFETPFEESYLQKLPLAYRFLVKRETANIGELYNKVKFSKSIKHRSIMMNNYTDFKPLSNLFIDEKIYTPNNE